MWNVGWNITRRGIQLLTYDEDAAENVFAEATEFVHDAKHLLKMLEARND